jgi:hypothetical protein
MPLVTNGYIYRYLRLNKYDIKDLKAIYKNGSPSYSHDFTDFTQNKDHWLLYLLYNSRLRLSQPKNFNDPYDCQVEFSNKLNNRDLVRFVIAYCRNNSFSESQKRKLRSKIENKKLIDKIEGEYINYPLDQPFSLPKMNLTFNDRKLMLELCKPTLQNLVYDSRIICFSKTYDITLMWAHYSDKHAGYCLEFDQNKLNQKIPLYPIKYTRTRPKIRLSPQELLSLEMPRKILLKKSPEWTYEQEYRAIVGHKFFSNHDSEYETFPPDALTRIIFGFKMPEKFQKAIKTLVSSLDQYRTMFVRSKLNPHKYKIDIEDF